MNCDQLPTVSRVTDACRYEVQIKGTQLITYIILQRDLPTFKRSSKTPLTGGGGVSSLTQLTL